MQKTKIEWTQYVWNPIKGMCPRACKLSDGKEYCYARKMYKRFGWSPQLRLDDKLFGRWKGGPVLPNIIIDVMLADIKPGSKIFICSTCELFHPEIPKEWRDTIFQVIKDNPFYTFQILTKMPENIDREMPDNVWLGTSITSERHVNYRMEKLYLKKAGKRFISFEPLLGDIIGYPDKPKSVFQFVAGEFDWVIIGKLTGHGNKYDPPKDWIQEIVYICKDFRIPVFLKDNLKKIWGDDLIQEFPE